MKDDMHEMEIQDDMELTGEDNTIEPELEDLENSSNQKIKKLQEKLKACEAEKSEHLENLQRAKAEFLNARKRQEEEKERETERVVTKHIQKLLPLCDSFQMATANEAVWNSVDEQWRKGVESIYTQLRKILQSYGVSEVYPLGEEFDPNAHEAMSEEVVTDPNTEHTIVKVIQCGYIRTINDKTELIRPARVIVGVLNN